jgi:hypothetical protein
MNDETKPAPANVEPLVEAYIRIRDEINKIQTKADGDKRDLEKQKERVECELRKILEGTGGSSISCKVGTVFVTEKTSAKVADWPTLVAFVKANEAYHLLNHAVNKTAVKEYLDTNEALPPGVDFSRHLDIQVRRK